MPYMDAKIIDLLRENCRMSSREIGAKLGMPVTTVHNRIKRMELRGVIKKYSAIIDEKKLGKHIQAFVHVSVSYKTNADRTISQKDLADRLRGLPAVRRCYIVTGTTDILLQISVSDVEDLNHFVTRTLRTIEGVSQTSTSIILSEVDGP